MNTAERLAGSLKNWTAEPTLQPDLILLLDVAKQLELIILESGEFADAETLQKIKPNHLKCMLRAGYFKRGGQLRGKFFDKLFIKFMLVLVSSLRRARANLPPEQLANRTREIFIDDDYLQT
jgi:hypothetical protein